MQTSPISDDAFPNDPAVWLPRLFSSDTRTALREWFGSSPSSPFVLQPALDHELAGALAVELRRSKGWRYHHWIRRPDESVTTVPEDEFLGTPPERRFSRNHALAHDACERDPDLSHVRGLLTALGQGETSELFAEVVGSPLRSEPEWEFARYVEGSFLAEHKDAFDGRRIGIIFYFSSPNWQNGWGGELGYRNEVGEVSLSPPVYNTAAIMPFRDDATHWVEALSGTGGVRYSLAAHYMEAPSR